MRKQQAVSQKIANPPKAWNALHQASARRLVKTEAKNILALRGATRSVHDALVGQLAQAPTRGHALQALKGARERMASTVAEQIEDMRERARDAALDQASAELDRLAAELRKAGFKGEEAFGVPTRTEQDADKATADAVGHSIAGSWAQSVLALLIASEADEHTDVAVKARMIVRKLDSSLKRVAATETAKAFSEQHEDAVEQALGFDPDLDPDADAYEAMPPKGRPRWAAWLFKFWNALLDVKTCAECRRHDGDVVPVGMDFDGGDRPGWVHPNCRCTPSLVFIPAPLGEQDQEDQDDEEAA